MKKAESLSQVLGLQLPTTLITFNHDNTVSRPKSKVNINSANSSKNSVNMEKGQLEITDEKKLKAYLVS